MNVVILPVPGHYEQSAELEVQLALPGAPTRVHARRFPHLVKDVWDVVHDKSVNRIDIVGHGSRGALRIHDDEHGERNRGLLMSDLRKSVTGVLGLQQFFPIVQGRRVGELRLLGCNTGSGTGTGRSGSTLLRQIERGMGGVEVLGTNRGITSYEFVNGLFPVNSSALVKTSGEPTPVPMPPAGPSTHRAVVLQQGRWRVQNTLVDDSARDALVGALQLPIVLKGSLLTSVQHELTVDFGVREVRAAVVSDHSGIVVRAEAEVQFYAFRTNVDSAQRERLIDNLGVH